MFLSSFFRKYNEKKAASTAFRQLEVKKPKAKEYNKKYHRIEKSIATNVKEIKFRLNLKSFNKLVSVRYMEFKSGIKSSYIIIIHYICECFE